MPHRPPQNDDDTIVGMPNGGTGATVTVVRSLLKDYVVYSQEFTRLRANTKVYSGNVGANDTGVFGTAHLIGPESLVAMLQARGYSVERVGD